MPTAMTRAQLEAYVQRELQDTAEQRWTLAVIRDYLNEGMGAWCEQTRARRKSTTIDVVALDATIDLSSVTPMVLEVLGENGCYLPTSEDGEDEYPLTHATEDEIARLDPAWRTRTGSPTHYMRFEEGSQGLRLYPIPDTAFAAAARASGAFDWDSLEGIPTSFADLTDETWDSLYGTITDAQDRYGGLRVYYVAGATAMTASSDTPYSVCDIPAEDHQAIGDYAAARCFEVGGPSKNDRRAAECMARFAAKVVARQSLTQNDFQANLPRRVRGGFF